MSKKWVVVEVASAVEAENVTGFVVFDFVIGLQIPESKEEVEARVKDSCTTQGLSSYHNDLLLVEA